MHRGPISLQYIVEDIAAQKSSPLKFKRTHIEMRVKRLRVTSVCAVGTDIKKKRCTEVHYIRLQFDERQVAIICGISL